jgi:CubicO group peptidase (beta-lactamase class C family)
LKEHGKLATFSPALDAVVREILVESRAPGAAITLVADGRSFLHTYGCEHDWRGAAPVGPGTSFDLGSCSKAFVSTAVARLVARGDIRFDDRVQPLLPEFVLDDVCSTSEVTIRDLLCNRIGLRRQLPIESFANPDIPALDVVRRIRWLDRVHPFRRGYVYFNPGFMAARLIVERVSGTRYDDFLDREIFRPLRMTASASGSLGVRRIARRARGHVLQDGRIVPLPERFFDNWQGAAGVYVSGRDASSWIAHQLAAQACDQALAETQQPHTRIPRTECKLIHAPPEEAIVDYCMGWWRTGLRGHRLLQHAGEMFGWRSQIALLPQDGVGVAVLLPAAVPRHAVLSYTILETVLCGSSRDWTTVARAEASEQARRMLALFANEFAPGTEPRLPLDAYTGRYRHPACGILDVRSGDGCLDLLLADGRIWDVRAWPVGGHVFRGSFVQTAVRDYAPADLPLRFDIVDGQVAGLTDTNAHYERLPVA